MLLMMISKCKLENTLSSIGHFSPRQLKDENAIRIIRQKLYKADSMAGGIDKLLSEAKALMQMLEKEG